MIKFVCTTVYDTLVLHHHTQSKLEKGKYEEEWR